MVENLAKMGFAIRWIDRDAGELEIDGGVDANTAQRGVEAGATVLVAGSSIFNAKESVATAMERLKNTNPKR